MIIDFTKIIKLKNKKIIFTIGTFDLFHNGHLYFLKEAKKISPKHKLLVGIISDKQTKSKKGPGRPVIKQKDRAKIVDSIKIVDYTFICPPIQNKNIVSKILKDIKPEISVVTKSSWTGKDIPKDTKLIMLKNKLNNLSTSKIINQIKGAKDE